MMRNFSLILLFDDKKRVLLQHRTEDAPRLPGYWAFFGGGIEAEEIPKTAVKRETYEELEYQLFNPKLVMEQKFKSAGISGIKYVFMERYDSDKKLFLKEGQGKDWFSLDEAVHLKMTDDDKEVLKFIRNKY